MGEGQTNQKGRRCISAALKPEGKVHCVQGMHVSSLPDVLFCLL